MKYNSLRSKQTLLAIIFALTMTGWAHSDDSECGTVSASRSGPGGQSLCDGATADIDWAIGELQKKGCSCGEISYQHIFTIETGWWGDFVNLIFDGAGDQHTTTEITSCTASVTCTKK